MTSAAARGIEPERTAVIPIGPNELDELRQELEKVRARLADSAETLRAISGGEVDALMIGAIPGQERIYTLATADRPYRNFVENMSDGAATISARGIVLYANQALADLVMLTCQQIVGHPVRDLLHQPRRADVDRMIGQSSPGGSVEATLVTSQGRNVPALVGSSALTVDGERVTCLTFTDLTNERRAKAEAAHLAQHDALTGLPNRALLTDRIKHALDRRPSRASLLALMFCDIDGFKNVNDAYGHQVGDSVLHIVAQRLSQAVRPEDTVARIGGDEFIVLCEGLGDLDDAAIVAARVRTAVSAPISIGLDEVEITLSIGVATATVDQAASADTLLRDSDEAMYKAKRQGPNVIELFDEQLRTTAQSRLKLLSEMRHAAADEQLRLHYQPIRDLSSGQLVGSEALVRWQHPTRGLVAPDEFIPFAERSGLIVGIGAWVFRETCRQAAEWTAAYPLSQPLYHSINISGRQLAQGAGLVETVRSAIAESGVEPHSLCLEVTESALMDDAEAALRVVNELRSLGVRIAIDDFGTGYSSLVYLKRFPVDALKVDKSFIAGLGQNHDDTAIVRSVIHLAQAFGIVSVAEGVETTQHLEILQQLGCTYGQGYLWSPALPTEQFRDYLVDFQTSQELTAVKTSAGSGG